MLALGSVTCYLFSRLITNMKQDITITDEEEVEYERRKDYTKSDTAANRGAGDGTEIKDIVAFHDVDMEGDEDGNE